MNNSSGKDSPPKHVLCGARVPLQLDGLSDKASEACVWRSPFSNNIRILKKCISFHLTRSSVILILPVPLRERMHLGVTLVTRSLHKQSRCPLPHPTRLHYDTFQSVTYYYYHSFLLLRFLSLLQHHISSQKKKKILRHIEPAAESWKAAWPSRDRMGRKSTKQKKKNNANRISFR